MTSYTTYFTLSPVYSSQTENEGILGYINSFDFEGTHLTWTTDGANAGTVFYRKGKFNCTNVCGIMSLKSIDIELKYFMYMLNQATSQYVRHDINPKLMNNVMAKIRICVPSFTEQRAISAFLDRETARIDALIDKKEQLIKLLQEKRAALISEAVTRELNSDAPMKDSGVEWLGMVPEHWEVIRLKFLADVLPGVAKGRDLGERDIIELPYLRVANVQDGYLDLSDIATIIVGKDEVERYLLTNGASFIKKTQRYSFWQDQRRDAPDETRSTAH